MDYANLHRNLVKLSMTSANFIYWWSLKKIESFCNSLFSDTGIIPVVFWKYFENTENTENTFGELRILWKYFENTGVL